MIRATLLTVAIVASVVLEYGLIHLLPEPLSLAPLGLSVALSLVFRLHPLAGLVWMMALGLAADVHAPVPVGETAIAALLGGALILVVRQYISHASWYAASVATVATVAAWEALRLALGFLGGVTVDTSLIHVAWEAGLGVVLVSVWFALLPRFTFLKTP